MTKKLTKNKKGFTLAELLVVVAIVAVLTAIAIPLFLASKEKAEEATRHANARSFHAECVVEMLTEEYDYVTEPTGTDTVYIGSGNYEGITYTWTYDKSATTGTAKVELTETGKSFTPASYTFNVKAEKPTP